MKIAILMPRLDRNNAVKSIPQARELAEDGNEVAMFAFSVADVEPEKAELFLLGMPKSLFWARIYLLIFPLDLFKTIRWLRKLKEYDLTIAHLYPMTWLSYLAKKFYGVKYTYWDHGIPPLKIYPHLYERVYVWITLFLARLTIRNADRIVSVSHFAQKELKRHTGLNSEVEYNEVDSVGYHPGIDGTGIRKRHQLGDAPVIFSLGRVSPHKGFHVLLEAFNLINQTNPDVKLVIGGKEDYAYYSKQLRQMSDGSVIFVGYISEEDKPAYFAMCDIYANCSPWESFNVPIAEAQACGKPVVAFDIGPHPEVVDKNGILVEFGNTEKFAQACIKKLKEVRGTQ